MRAVVGTVAGGAFALLGRRVRWYRLPTRFSLLNLAVLRRQLRRDNLIDGEPRPRRVEVRQPTPLPTDAIALMVGEGAGVLVRRALVAAGLPVYWIWARRRPPDLPSTPQTPL